MRTEIQQRGIPMKILRALILALASFCAVTATAQASPAPAPALRLVAITGPTHLPPMQSEVQRVTVEAEGGTFTFTRQSQGEGTPVVAQGHLSLTAGSAVATIESVEAGAEFAVGDRITEPGAYEPSERTIVSCSGDCKTPGSTVTLSNPAVATEANAPIEIFTKELTALSGEFHVGDEVAGSVWPYFAPETVVTAVNGATVTLSKATTFEYWPPFESTIGIAITGHADPIAYDASPQVVQSALEGFLGAGSVSVTGGPGGDAAHPYNVAFRGPFSDEDVEQLVVDRSGLSGEHAFVHVFTTVPGGRGTGDIYLMAANVGAESTNGTITAHVGPLPPGIVTTGPAHGGQWSCPGGAGETEVTCTTEESFRSLHSTPHAVDVPIEVQADAPASAEVPTELSGGGSVPATYQLPIVVSSKPAPFGVAAIWAASNEADGSPTTQAGGHPYASAAYIMLNTQRTAAGVISPTGDSRDVVVELPPGFVGNPLATKRCPQSVPLEPKGVTSELCNEEMSVGNLDPYIGDLAESFGFESHLYNDHPPKGYAAEFTTRLALPLQSVVATVNSEKDFGIRLNGPNNATLDKIYGVFALFEGVPKFGNGQALLTSPVNCAETAEKPPVVLATADTYQDVGHFSELVAVKQPPLEGCEKLKFEAEDPSTGKGQVGFTFQPTSTQGSSPVGATAHLHIANPGLTDPNELATPELKRSVIKLPVGLSLNPSSANGLEGCSEAQIGYKGSGFPMPNPMRFNEVQPACPDGSKLGTAEIRTPLLDNPLVGEIFLANQEENPFGSLLAVYLVVNDPLTGVLIKLPGEVQPDLKTGRLTTTFDNNPQLPFEDLYLHFRGGGPRSEFATSEICGNFPTEGEWTPWSAPESGPPAQTLDSFTVSSNCASSPQARPFAPSFEAGTTAAKAGAYSPLVVKINRKDGEQELTKLDFTLPKGLIGKLAGIPYCSDAQIAAAAGRTGRAELASPSCPAASRLGSVDTAAGVGSDPVHVGGDLYLAGPYKGAPVSSVVVTPGVAGPYDLGTVVVRAPLYIDPESAQLTAKSDPIPTILRGIPLKVRSVAINVDRPGFILNPTSCEPMSAQASLSGGSGATATPSNRFQVGSCSDLGFAPKLELSLKGGTKRNRNPALTAVLTQPQGQANIGKVAVTLPHSEFLDQSHIRTVCTRVQFSANACPSGAIYGEAEALTPLLDQPLKGPVYLRSSSNKLPDLVVALKGPASQPIEVNLAGRIDSIKGGIRNSFELVPDAPVSKFVLRMQGGKKGLLVNSTDICRKTNRATVKMEGQNGKLSNSSPPLAAQCKSARKKHKKSKAKGAKNRVRSKLLGGR